MHKIVRLGTRKTYGGRGYSVYCEITIKDGNLSIHGVEGPLPSGNCLGSCGQIDMSGLEMDGYAPGWSKELVQEFAQVWDRWHLNDMKAGCPHQRALGWDTERIDPSKETGWHVDMRTANLKRWLPETEGGYLSKPCPECGYKYGTAWLKEELPQEVIDFLASLPKTDRQPAWV